MSDPREKLGTEKKRSLFPFESSDITFISREIRVTILWFERWFPFDRGWRLRVKINLFVETKGWMGGERSFQIGRFFIEYS